VAGAEKSLEKSSFFAFEWHCRPTDAPRKAEPCEWLGAAKGASLLSCRSAVGIPQPPIPRIHRRDDEVSSFKILAQIAAPNAAQTRYRPAAEWLSEGPFERRFSARQRQSARLRNARSANCRGLRYDRKESALAGAFVMVRREDGAVAGVVLGDVGCPEELTSPVSFPVPRSAHHIAGHETAISRFLQVAGEMLSILRRWISPRDRRAAPASPDRPKWR
jgi:hypothetical protein